MKKRFVVVLNFVFLSAGFVSAMESGNDSGQQDNTEVLTISPADFQLHADNINDVVIYDALTMKGGDPDEFTIVVAPVHLPDGCTITDLEMVSWGGSGGRKYKIEASLCACYHTQDRSGMIEYGRVKSKGYKRYWHSSFSTSISNNHVKVNNINYYYVIRVALPKSKYDELLGCVRVHYTKAAD